MAKHGWSKSSRHRRKAFTLGWSQKALIALTVVYVLWSLSTMGVSAERLSAGWAQGARFIAQMFPPETGKMEELWQGIKETLQIAVLATVIGLLLSLPVGLMSASNMAPAPVRAVGRTIIAVCRALHPVISAILFVKAVGFGPLAGILALVVATVGFVGKLFADAIEEISPKPIEAIRATGASFMNVVLFGVLPQVISRFVGFSTYQPTPTCATPPWSASWVPVVLVACCLPPSCVTNTTLCSPFCSP